MKYLLLAPLLFLLAGCSNNVTMKTNVGEKILVKNSTVYTTNSNRNDLIKLIEKRIDQRKSIIEFDVEQISYYKNRLLKEQNRCIPRSKEYYLCMSSQISYNQEQYDDRVKIKDSDEEILSILKDRKSQVNKTNEEIIHYVSVTYTPVYIDLNNKKRSWFSGNNILLESCIR